MTTYTIEAEDMTLSDDLEVVSGDQASGGELVRLDDFMESGTLSTTFDGETGTYSFTIYVQDESDGQSQIDLIVDGVVVGTVTLDADTDGGGSNDGGFSAVTFDNVQIENGESFSIALDGNEYEYVRVDRIVIDNFVPPADPDCIVIEAEDMNLYNFDVVHGDQASSGELVKIDGAGESGDISTSFNGPTGCYNLTVFAQDESDGQSDIIVKVNGVAVGTITLNRDTDGGGSDNGGFSQFTLPELDLAQGDTITLWAGSDGGEFLRIDKLELKPCEPSNNAPVAVDDAFVTDEETSVSGNLLANDSDPDGDAITVIDVDGRGVGEAFQVTTANGFTGTVTVQADGSFSFDPDDNFQALAQGETDTFELTYTISDDPTADVKHNLLFVIDISNSTVGTSGNNAFDGVGVGDVNNDGVADTVLDAEIAAVIAAVNGLIADGVDPANIDVGIVTFSGIASGFATIDAETLGTFSIDDSNLFDTLTDIDSGGWTNYEAGLQEAETWFAGQQGDNAANKLVFLSDGRPIIGVDDDGDYVSQTNADYGDEVSRIAGTYDAQIHGIGVGANSDLDYLNDLDNTGGAERVLDASTLNVVVSKAVATPATATATVTVTVNGLNEGPDALNDALTVDEDVVGSVNILANDSDPENDALSITDIAGNSVGTSFSVTTAEGRMGTVTVDATGNLTFDPGTGFEDLNDTETDSFQISYTISDGQFSDTATVTVVVNGKGVPVDAIDDAFSINEDQDIAANVLTNDTPNDGSLTVIGVAEDGVAQTVGSSFTVTTDNGRTGTVTVDVDGSFTFDGGENFIEMAQGETDTFDLTYTVEGAARAGDIPKHNILFIIDISGSVSPAQFGGSAVGDQNGDGVENSVLDAEIAAYKALSQQIADSGLTDDKVDIGLIVFAGNDPGSTQFIDSQLLGTFKPGGADLDAALEGLTDAGWTNFEAPLQTSIDWFEDQAATTDDKNIVYFLSDGEQNRGGAFDDESAELASRFGAELNAVGVGTGAVLEQLNVIDNTGGAEIVTTTDALTAALVDTAPVIPGDQDTATITVTINGLNEGPDALNDALTVDEDTAGTINILANDSDPEDDALTITDVAGNATGTTFAVTTAEGRSGTVLVDDTGNLTFDPGAGFADLNDAQTDSFQISYTISDGQFTDTATVTVIVNGKGVPVDAVDDAFSVAEEEDISANILDNDTPNDGTLSVINVAEDGVAQTVDTPFTVTTDGGRSGIVTVGEDGSFTFDGGDNFIDLVGGETDTFDLTYTVEGAATAGSVPKHNILFVIDISGSTSPATFAGSPVGDLNGDGVADSVLDAEIAAYKALSQQIADSGLTDDKVDIGLVAFSGNNSADQTGASELLGTFKPGDAALDAALEGLTDGGFTNFEAPLQTGIQWFEDQAATTIDKNIVYFLSDGMQNVGGTFDDEAAELATRFGAELNAVGVGTDAVLGQLNVIDNTGGAEIVTTSDDLTAALVDNAPVIPGDQDTATITVTINGVGVNAGDDELRTDEATAASIDILANDSAPAGQGLCVFDISGAGAPDAQVGTAFMVTTAAGRTGMVTVQENGTFDFDPMDGFVDLDEAETDSFQLNYTMAAGAMFNELSYELYDGTPAGNTVANIPLTGALETGTAGDLDATALATAATGDSTTYAVRYTGVITIEEGGVYDFNLTSDDGSALFINGVQVIDNDGLHALLSVPGQASLSAGQHEIEILFFQNFGGAGLDLTYSGTDTGGVATSILAAAASESFETAEAVVDVMVLGLDSAPAAEPDALVTDEGVSAEINILANDSDPENDTLTVASIEGGTVGTPMTITTAAGRSGMLTVLADGTFTFDPGTGFDDLAEGATDTITLNYTATDGVSGDTASVTITVNGRNAAPVAVDDATSTSEDTAVTINILGNDSDPDDDALTIVDIQGNAVDDVFQVTTGEGRTGTVSVDQNGDFTFTPDQSFAGLNDGETDTVNVTYTISDGQFTDTAEVTVVVNGSGSPNGKVTVSGSISTVSAGQTHVVLILDSSFEATGLAAGFPVGDLDSDGNVGTVFDLMLQKVADLAQTLDDADNLTLIPSGLNFAPDSAQSFTFTAAQIKAASGSDADLAALFVDLKTTYDSTDIGIDLEESLQKAEVILNALPGEQNEVIAMTTTETFEPTMSIAAASSLEAATGADINVVYIPSGGFVSLTPFELIDNEDMVDTDTDGTFGLATLIDPAPTVSSGDLVEFGILLDGAKVQGIDETSLIDNLDGTFTFEATDIDLNGLTGELDVRAGLDRDGDPTTLEAILKLSSTVSSEDRTVEDGDSFVFDLA
ncbi:MAG: Ig-like domain-containing protein [Pseudomonadota bacterium]